MLDYRPDWYPSPWGDEKILGTAHCLAPTERGTYRPVMGNTASTYSATFSDVPIAAFATTLTDGSFRIFGGSQAKIWEAASGGFTDRSASTYSATGTWWFSQIGDVTIATDYVDVVQQSSAGAFANLAGSPPKAKIAVSQSNVILLFNINDGTARPDGYATSDVVGLGGSPATWTVANTNECKRGRFTDTPGPITNACAFRDGVLVFKRRGIWFGRYVGRPLIWKWELVSDKVGCASTFQGGAITAGETCYFGGDGKIFAYDGVGVRSISDGMDGQFSQFVYSYQSTLRIHHLEEKSLLVFWWNVGGSDKMRAYAHNYVSGKWGGRTTGAQWFPAAASLVSVVPIQCDRAQGQNLKSITAQITSFAFWVTATNAFLDAYDELGSGNAASTLDLPFIGNGESDSRVEGLALVMLAGGVSSGAGLTVYMGQRNLVDTAREGFANPSGSKTVSGSAYQGARRRFDFTASAPFIMFRMTLPNQSGTSQAQLQIYYPWELADIIAHPSPTGKTGGHS